MQFPSKYGHFSDDGREYVITRPDTPRPWVNVISNGDYGLVVSQAGGGFSWRTHSNLNRLTRWSQDLLRDEQGKYLYLRDEDTGDYWSATYQPTTHAADSFACRHGIGYTVFEQEFRDIMSKLTMFVATDAPCELWLLEVSNRGPGARRISLTSYLEFCLGAAPDQHREFHKLFIEPVFDARAQALLATKCLWEVPTDRGHWNADWPYVAFHATSAAVQSFDADRASFMGRHRGPDRPAAMAIPELAGNAGRWGDAAGALRSVLEIPPGTTETVVYVLGAADDAELARAFIGRFKAPEAARRALADVHAFWERPLAALTVETPDPAFDLMTNTWLKYQAISGHLWGRAAYYQQSGAYGFRDQLQTSQVWLPLDPPQMRRQLLLHARHQFGSGKVLHWWHPLTDEGLPTEMTDDLLWLPYMTAAYLRETVDWALLAETVPFRDGGAASLLDHCRRAIAVVLGRISSRGLPLMGEGDWCDGFSAVGLDGKGESIWLGHFLLEILEDWAEILGERLGTDPAEAARWRERAEALRDALNGAGWAGDRYLCGTTDAGELLGDACCTDNQIYLNTQTWAVIAGTAEPTRAREAMATAHRLLEGDNGMLLFQPAYRSVDRHIGYITRYAPGLRENGGVYTHAATWAILADAILGDGAGADRLYQKLNPVAASTRDPDRYAAEPYVLPGNIDGPDSPHCGRAGWTWYTGSAGWLFTIGLGAICGVQATYDGLRLAPCLPPHWDRVRIHRNFRGCRYDIRIRRAGKGESASVTVDGAAVSGNLLPACADGKSHVVDACFLDSGR